jgi:hypothetical protein
MEGGVDVLDHVGDVGVVLVDELVDGAKLCLEGPVPQLLHLSPLDLVHCQELGVVILVAAEEAALTDQPRGQGALRPNADVEDVFAVVATHQALRRHRPLHPSHLTPNAYLPTAFRADTWQRQRALW